MNQEGFAIITETTCDLPQSYLKEHKIYTVPLTYSVGDVEYDGTYEHCPTPHQFYDMLRDGVASKTAQTAPETVLAKYRSVLTEYDSFLHISFSSGLSGSCQSATIALTELKAETPEIQGYCVDSLCASLGQGLLVDFAVKKRAEGLTAKETAEAVEKMKLQLCHYFTVDDLNHLYRGGRVSKTAAIFGTMLGIKPVMHVDDEGHLIPIGKVRGRRASLDELAKKMGAKLSSYQNPYAFISHGDCIEDAKYLAEQVKKLHGIKTEIINDVGAVIGTHSGPGTVALFFFGSDRHEHKM